MNKLISTIEELVTRYTRQHKRSLELEKQRDTWIMRAVSMATADDLAQWARDGGGLHDIQLSGSSS